MWKSTLDWSRVNLLREFSKCVELPTFACLTCSFKNDDYVTILDQRIPNAKRQAVEKNGPDYLLACGHTVRPLIEIEENTLE